MSLSAMPSDERNGVVARITAILESFSRESPRRPLHEIAAAANLPPSTTRRLLVQLEAAGLIAQDDHSHLYAPTAKLAHIGALAAHSASLEEVVRPSLRRLSELSGEAAFLGALDGDAVTYRAQETAAREIVMSIQTGDTRPALTTSLGTVLLAHRLNAGLPIPKFTADEIEEACADRFGHDSATLAHTGYAVGIGGVTRESTSLAIPLRLPDRDLVSAIAISGPMYRFDTDRALALLPAMRAEAERILSAFPATSSPTKESS